MAGPLPQKPPDLEPGDLVTEMLQEAALVRGEREIAPAVAASPSVQSAARTRAPVQIWSLFARHGPDFVRHAWLELLGREPRQAELAEFSSALLDGRLAKIEIIGRIRYSPEGKAFGRQVPSLRSRFLLARLYRLPIVGRLARIMTALARMPRLLSDMQRLEQNVQHQVPRIDRLERSALADAAAQLNGLRARVLGMEERVSSLPDPKLLAADLERRREHDAAVADSLLSLADRLEMVERLVRALKRQQAQSLETFLAGALRRLDHTEAEIGRQRVDLIDQQNRLSFILEDVRKRLSIPFTPAEAERLSDETEHQLDSLYVAFENRFRGTREDIKSRQTVYLPIVQECGAGTPERPILDVGCGRGEWLELLKERGLTGRGVDLNRSMVGFCQDLGLDVTFGDAIESLGTLPPGSLGAITGFHIIEHLPFKAFVQLLDLSLRALASGGIIIFETPNPENLIVGSRNFYLDPTHRAPMPKEMTMVIAEARGFVRPHARELHPMNASFGAADRELGRQLDRLFFGPQDYALIAWRP